MSTGWISPYCTNCKNSLIEDSSNNLTSESFVRINEIKDENN